MSRADDSPPALEDAPEMERAQQSPWWEDESVPWRKEPQRADYACLAWFGVIAIFSIVLIPARAWLLGAAPDVLAMITGGRTAVAVSGVLAGVGQLPHWPVMLLIASVLSLKFDWIYRWAGVLWGRGMIEVWSGRSPRAAKGYAIAEKWANKLGPLGFFIAYIPLPLPLMQAVFVLSGASGMTIRKFLFYDYVASMVWLGFYFWLGWQLGEPAVAILNSYAAVSGYIAMGLLFIIVLGVLRGKGDRGVPQ